MHDTDAETDPQHRRIFHKSTGGIDFSRLLEQLIPLVVCGALVVWANTLVTQSKVDDVRAAVKILEDRVFSQNDKLIALNAQVAAYLGQQTQLNAAMDARLTYLERSQPRR